MIILPTGITKRLLAWVHFSHFKLSGRALNNVFAGPTFLRKIKVAVSDRAIHAYNFEELSGHLSRATVAGWTVEVEAWEKDPTMTNPFVSVVEGTFILCLWYLLF